MNHIAQRADVDDDLVASVADAAATRQAAAEQTELELQRAVRVARLAGISWSRLSRALGYRSETAARNRYSWIDHEVKETA
jgi:hypothetical protein